MNLDKIRSEIEELKKQVALLEELADLKRKVSQLEQELNKQPINPYVIPSIPLVPIIPTPRPWENPWVPSYPDKIIYRYYTTDYTEIVS